MLKLTNEEIIEGVLAEFSKLAQIPRMSKHEEAVSSYLYGVFHEMGCRTIRDRVNNIVAILPATKGWQSAPTVGFQAHMDMVCVAEPGKKYDPLTDPIELVYDDKYGAPGEYLRANGTTLGADDGIGVAEAIYIMKQFIRTNEPHGELRVIVTVDEEQGMTGAINLDGRALGGLNYLFNCDSENYDELTVGSAGSINLDFTRQVRWMPLLAERGLKAMGASLCRIGISGLLGGHSGMEIHKGRGNAIRALARVLLELQKNQVEYRIVTITGGKARNSIPAEAEAIIMVSEKSHRDGDGKMRQHSGASASVGLNSTSNSAEGSPNSGTAVNENSASGIFGLIENVLTKEKELFLRTYGKSESPEKVKFTVEEISIAEAKQGKKRLMLMDKDTGYLLPQLIAVLSNGVSAMSKLKDGLVETSANIGRLDTTEAGVRLIYFPRSSVDAKLLAYRDKAQETAEELGFQLEVGNMAPGWKENPDSRLAAVMQEVFLEQNGFPMKVETIHAGLECGYHFQKNPKLDIVSIGVSTFDIHSPQERLLIWTIASQVQLMLGTIAKL